MVNICNKKILFIGTSFFDFDEAIIKKMEERGASVSYFSSALTSPLRRIAIRLGYVRNSTRFVSGKLMKLIEQQPSDIDYIFIVKADCFREEHIAYMKLKYPNVPVSLYLWDSLRWLQNRELLLRNFDIIYTFDRKDAIKYHLRFRPLFYRSINVPIVEKPFYDLSFVGSWHTQRYEFLRKIIPQLKKNGLKYKFILRGAPFSIFWDKYLTRKIKKEDFDMFCTTPIHYNDYLKLCMNSKVVLDIANPMQSGLTMRTIEMMGIGKKILTTNCDISNYDIDNNSFSIININKPIIDKDFFKSGNCIRQDIKNYSIDSFLDEVLHFK